LETKRAVAAVAADVKPDVAFLMWPHDRHHDHEGASVLSNLALRHGDRVWYKGPAPAPKRIYAYDNGPRHTIGFEPNPFVDITAEWATAAEWLGRFTAVTRNQKYDPKTHDAAVRAKEVLAAYRGETCGVRYAEAVWAINHSPRDIL
jgi:LmbE family N-acetylglucosaminyl deacetylase